jgi:hypothetical protein
MFISPYSSLLPRSNAFNGFIFSFACPGKMNPWDMCVVTNEFFFSDWLFLYYLARNMEPYLFRQMLLEHIIPEIQSERNSMIYSHGSVSSLNVSEAEKLSNFPADEVDKLSDAHSLNSLDMDNGPVSPLIAVNEKRVKFA